MRRILQIMLTILFFFYTFYLFGFTLFIGSYPKIYQNYFNPTNFFFPYYFEYYYYSEISLNYNFCLFLKIHLSLHYIFTIFQLIYTYIKEFILNLIIILIIYRLHNLIYKMSYLKLWMSRG